MKISCNSCGKTLNIPDEKIPLNKTISVSCPGCKNKIAIKKPTETDATAQPSSSSTEKITDEPTKAVDPGQFMDDELEIFEEGVKRALVCDTTHQEKIVAVLKSMDYVTKTVTSVNEAVGRMKFTQYDLIILAEDFAGSTLESNNILKYIQPMAMTIRRKMFVAMLGSNFRTMDNMKAFAHSMNVVINYKDMDNLNIILKKSISENDSFYKVYKETLIAVGKA